MASTQLLDTSRVLRPDSADKALGSTFGTRIKEEEEEEEEEE